MYRVLFMGNEKMRCEEVIDLKIMLGLIKAFKYHYGQPNYMYVVEYNADFDIVSVSDLANK